MSCSCNNSYYNLPCCCPTGDPTTTHTTTQCLNGEPCEEAYSSDCVIYTENVPCYGISVGSTITEIIQILIAQLPQCTTTTTLAPTTSTTTLPPDYCFTVTNTTGSVQILNVITTTGVNSFINLTANQVINACFRSVITSSGGALIIVNNGICGLLCPPPTTTTTSSSTTSTTTTVAPTTTTTTVEPTTTTTTVEPTTTTTTAF